MSGLGLSPGVLAAFAACVVLAAVVQNLTGFALGLVMLGLVAMLQLVPLPDAANAAMVLALVNGIVYFRAQRAQPPWKRMRPALAASFFGVVIGLALLAWLSAHAVQWLRLLLGASIVLSAAALLMRPRPAAPGASQRGLARAGFLAGLMGGLFSASGPPMVFHMYRQPLDVETIRRCLVLVFATNAAVRLVLVLASGGFSARSAVLAAVAAPLVFGITRLMAGRPPKVSRQVLNRVAAGLLVLTGVLLATSALRHILAPAA